MIRHFNGNSMVGLTDADNEALNAIVGNEDDSYIDSVGRCWYPGSGAGSKYIADVEEVEPGEGLYC